MPDFVLRVEGEYSVVFEAPDFETAVLLAQVSDEWSDVRAALLSTRDGVEVASMMVGG